MQKQVTNFQISVTRLFMHSSSCYCTRTKAFHFPFSIFEAEQVQQQAVLKMN